MRLNRGVYSGLSTALHAAARWSQGEVAERKGLGMINHPEILRQLAADMQRERLLEAAEHRLAAEARPAPPARGRRSWLRVRKPLVAPVATEESSA